MLTSHHYHHSHQRFTTGHATPCLTTESACRFHRPAVIKIPSPQQQGSHGTLMAGKRDRGMQNKTRMLVQSRRALRGNVLEERAVQFEDIHARLAVEKAESVSHPSCYWKPITNGLKFTTPKSGNAVKLSEITTCKYTPGLSRTSSLLLSEISSRKLLFQQALLLSSSVSSLVTSLVQNDFVFSNFSQGSTCRSNNHRLFANTSYICVA